MNPLQIDTDSLLLNASISSWDTDTFSIPVASISCIQLKKRGRVSAPMLRFQEWVRDNKIMVVSCRLPHSSIEEAMLLEKYAFRFVEMVLHPVASNLKNFPKPGLRLLTEKAIESDLPVLGEMAEKAFKFERYHVDPRVDSLVANLRYRRWVESSFHNPDHEVVKVVSETRDVVAFFVTQKIGDRSIYWHLTAVNPQFQRCGNGYQSWLAMIDQHSHGGGMKFALQFLRETRQCLICIQSCPLDSCPLK
jgi:hypothetical protein